MARQVIIDTETTGKSTVVGRHRIVEIALVEIKDGKITGHSFSTRLNPQGRKSTQGVLDIHGIKDSLLLDEPLFGDVLPDILKFIGGSELVFFNKAFDSEFMDKEASLSGSNVVFSTNYKTFCVQAGALEAMNRSKLSLDSACMAYGVDNSEHKLHGALIDAQLTARDYLNLLSTPRKKTPYKSSTASNEKFARKIPNSAILQRLPN